jgi:hypothetical protein
MNEGPLADDNGNALTGFYPVAEASTMRRCHRLWWRCSTRIGCCWSSIGTGSAGNFPAA